MDTVTLAAGLITLILLGVTVDAKRIGNERRDVAALGVTAGLCGLGTLATPLI